MTKCFTYSRVSTIGQKNGDGYDRQHDAVSKYAAANDIEIVQEFKDCFTGSRDALDRPGLNELFVAIKANGVRLVLVENATRLARDLMVGEIILTEFKKLGVKVISAEGGTDMTVGNDDPTAKLIRQILSCLAEWDKALLVQKLAVARRRIRASGKRCDGKKPFGLMPGEADTLAAMKLMRAEGQTLRVIAVKLNEAGAAARKSGSRWHVGQVGRILARG
jgi:site-specific DNA recombinase